MVSDVFDTIPTWDEVNDKIKEALKEGIKVTITEGSDCPPIDMNSVRRFDKHRLEVLRGHVQESKDIREIFKKDIIEKYSHCIRMVVVCFIELLNEPYPYKIKRNLPLIKEHHKLLLEVINDTFYSEIVKYADYDMFEDVFFALKGDTREYKDFFTQYTTSPNLLDLNAIKANVPERYLANIDLSLFDL